MTAGTPREGRANRPERLENTARLIPGGLFIVFEGIDGTGKTTQLHLLAEKLRQRGYAVVSTREPTEGVYGQKIRELFVDRGAASPERELELFIADREQHVKETIEPALADGCIVLSDRYYLSTVAYQGANAEERAPFVKAKDGTMEEMLEQLAAMFGEGGKDKMIGGPGKDFLAGGKHRDKIKVKGGGTDEVNCGKGKDLADQV